MTGGSADSDFAWLEGMAVAATVCDRDGICRYMNEHAARQFAKDGGRSLVGKSLLDCHPEPARSHFRAQLATPSTNTYTIEKNGKWKLIQQLPWWRNGEFSGVIELGLEIPSVLPHFIRD